MKVIVYNSITDREEILESSSKSLLFNTESDFEEFDDWCNEHLEENGFYELDAGYTNEDSEAFLIDVPDDEEGWESNFDEMVLKLKDYLNINQHQ